MESRSCTLNIRAQALFSTLTILIITMPIIQSQANIIYPNTALIPTSSSSVWSSPSGALSMGFFSFVPGSYYVGIWYASLPLNQSIIWTANRAQSVSANSTLHFTVDGRLQLITASPNSSKAASLSSLDAIFNASQAELLDSGNFVLKSSTSKTLWQSFDHPTDTLLPSQNFSFSSSPSLVPWVSINDPSPSSKHSLVFGRTAEPLGRIRLLYQNAEYWSEPPPGVNTALLNTSINIDEKGTISLYNGDGNLLWFNTSCDNGIPNSLTKLQLSVDGNLRVLKWSNASRTWDTQWRALYLQCDVFGTCGDNGVCDKNQNVVSVGGGGCPLPEVLQLEQSLCTCRQGYARNGLNCVADSGAYSDSNNFTSGANSDSNSLPDYAIALIVVAISLIFVLFFAGLFIRHQIRSRYPNFKEVLLDPDVLGSLKQFSFEDLYMVTRGFHKENKLGAGGFGTVYKGTFIIPHGKLDVAIKRLDRQGFEMGHGKEGNDFLAEIETLGSIKHVNVVNLMGFCAEGPERLLVYEFVVNGSLNNHILNESSILDWDARFQIAVGAATGIEYLHAHCPKKIVHRDIKPDNILIDEEFKAKVADFGVSQIMGPERTHITNNSVRGTLKYMAPECRQLGAMVTEKADAYSYGMVLLELVSGRRVTKEQEEAEDVRRKRRVLPLEHALKVMEREMGWESLVDERLEGVYDREEAERLVKLVFWCLQGNQQERPSMEELVVMIKGHKAVGEPPLLGLFDFGGASYIFQRVNSSSQSSSSTMLPEQYVSQGR